MSELDIPNEAEWPAETLSRLFNPIRRGTAPIYVEHSPVRAIGQRCVTRSGFDVSHARPHSSRAMAGTLQPERGDTLLNSTGTGTIGRSCIFEESDPFIVDGHVTLLRPARSGISGQWLDMVLRSNWGQNHLERFCYSGSTNQVELSRTELSSTSLPVPSPEEQTTFHKIIHAFDTAIQRTEAIIAKLKQVKHGLLHDLLTRGIDANGELRPAPTEAPDRYKDSPVGLIPKEWEAKQIGPSSIELLDGDRGPNYPQGQDFHDEGHCLFLSAKNVSKSGTNFDECMFITSSKHQSLGKGAVQPGDIIVTTRGTLGNFALFASLYGHAAIRINSGMAIIRNTNCMITTEFLYFQLSSDFIANQIAINAYGSAQPQLNIPILKSLLIRIPPPGEQCSILNVISQLQKRIDEEVIGLRKHRLFKTGLMDDLLTGRRRVTDLLKAAG